MKLSSIILEKDENVGYHYDLSKLTYDEVERIFPILKTGDDWERKVHFPNPDDSMRQVKFPEDFENWKEGIIDRYGDVTVKLYPNADAWFSNVKIDDKEFNKDKKDYSDEKGAWLDKERSAGRSSGLD